MFFNIFFLLSYIDHIEKIFREETYDSPRDKSEGGDEVLYGDGESTPTRRTSNDYLENETEFNEINSGDIITEEDQDQLNFLESAMEKLATLAQSRAERMKDSRKMHGEVENNDFVPVEREIVIKRERASTFKVANSSNDNSTNKRDSKRFASLDLKSELDANQLKIKFILNEIVDTEEAYVGRLLEFK